MFLTTFLILKELSLVFVIFPDIDSLHFGPFTEIKIISLSWSSLSHRDILLLEIYNKA